MSATRSARVATSRSWARVFSSWVPKMAGWGTRQFSPYLGSMFRHCLLLIGVLPGAAAPAASQDAGALRDRLEARVAPTPGQAVGLYYPKPAGSHSLLIWAKPRVDAARTMKLPGVIQNFPGAGARLLWRHD